ncbi:MAG: flotillin domain-containing protein [Polyangiales bacterium]
MSSSLNEVSGVALGAVVGGVLFVFITIFTTFARFYRRCGADEALVRTGSGGNKVVIGGGVIVAPVLHQLLRVSLRSVKLSVERSSKNALVTADKIKANVTTELFIKVEPIHEDVLAAARSFGERNLNEHAIADLIEGKLTDALRSVAANKTFMALHTQRKEFAESIQAVLAEELKKNGLTLENVSITAFSMVPVRELDEHDVFDADGLRAITESVQTNREKTNQIQREKDNAIHAQNVTARMRELDLDQQQKQAEADQSRRVSEYAAAQASETAKAIYIQEQSRDMAAYDKMKSVETARISQEQAIAVAMAAKQRAEREAQIAAEKGQQGAEIAKQREIEAAVIEKDKIVQAAEIDRQKALEAATIEKEKVVGASLVAKEQAIEVARIEKTIAVTKSEEAQARAAAAKGLALADEETAKQAILTVETTAKADREKAIRVIQAEAEAEVRRALATGEAQKAQGLAEAALFQAKGAAAVVQAQADAEGMRIRIGAEAKAEAAKKEAEAATLLAEATRQRGQADADARRKMVEAENLVAFKFVLRDIALKAIDTMPMLARELMEPAKAIKEIRVLQTNNGNGNGGGNGAMGSVSPILKTILEAGAAYPMMKELMQFAHDTEISKKLPDQAKALLGELGTELETVMKEKDAQPRAPGG